MKILYILNSTSVAAGANKSFLAMLRLLIVKGVEAHVLLPDSKGIYTILKNENIPVYVLNYRAHIYPKVNSFKNLLLFLPRLLFWMILEKKAVKNLKNIANKQNFDLIHTNVSVINIGYKVAVSAGIPHVYHIREYGDLDFGMKYIPSRKKLLNQLRRSNNWSVCITKDIQRHYNLQDCSQSKVVYNGIINKMDENTTDRPDYEKRFFLFAGRIEKAKGVDDLLDAYLDYVAECQESPIPLYLAGEYSDKDYYDNLLSKLHNNMLGKLVFFLGQVDKIKELMSKAWAIVIPSVNEGFGRCMAEAMSEHCLVIGRDTGGTKEQFDNGLMVSGQEIGYRYQTREQLKGLLKSVSTMTQKEREAFVNPAFIAVNRLYTVESNVDSVFSLYKDILG